MGHAVALGSGLVGRFVIERLLEAGHEVTVIDLHIPDAFHANPRVHVREGDAMAHIATLEPNQIVVNMLPGRIGDMVRPVLLKAGHQIVDLAFTAEDPHQHEALAVANGSVLLWDVGIAPGISNMLVKQAFEAFGPLDTVSIKVGGNPTQMDDGWSYMAPFSPSDVIEEYTRPARIKVDGVPVEVPALTERHAIEVEGYGTMEAFLTDGLRSVLDTIPCATMNFKNHCTQIFYSGIICSPQHGDDFCKKCTFIKQYLNIFSITRSHTKCVCICLTRNLVRACYNTTTCMNIGLWK